MLENSSVKETFDRLASNGCVGDPEGELAYCYIRVSSAQQAEDGRTGLPRQIEHCHQIALERHLKIPWGMVFPDDGFSGFEFENRPALSALREEIKKQPRSRYLVIEHLDRLSRNARWHQGFLLDEFAIHRITPVFWKAFGSEIERAVLGTISEEGMRAEISRMVEGMRLKAESGRVTAKHPRFGYMFVDGEGKVSEKARQDTHYALHPEKSGIVRLIYTRVLQEHMSLNRIAYELNEKKVPTMFNGKLWCSGTVWRIISDPVYKGEFYAHRWYCERNGKVNEKGRPKGITRQRPREEWIKVSVPAIVSSEEWERAQTIMKANQKRATRNMKKREWLLSSFLKCDICKYGYVASIGGSPDRGRAIFYYGCSGRYNDRARALKTFCRSPYVRADKLETFVWSKIEELITNPELFLKLAEQSNQDEEVVEEENQLRYLETQLEDVANRHERWKKAYESGAITLAEYKDLRTELNRQRADLGDAKKEIEGKIGKRMSREEQRRLILVGLGELRQGLQEDGETKPIPFDIKRRLIQQILDRVWVDSENKNIRLEGVLKASYGAEDTQFVFGSNLKSR